MVTTMGRRNGCENFFDPPTLAYLGGMKQNIAVSFTAIMASDLD